MSELNERLNKVMNRLEDLERAPSELTKDSLLADLRELYDAVKNVDTVSGFEVTVEQDVEEPKVEEKPEETESQPTSNPVVEAFQKEVQSQPEEQIVEPTAEVEKVLQPEPTEESMAKEPELSDSEPVAEKKPFIGNDEKVDKSTDKKILAGQLSRKPLEDLRTGIPLNEKFGIIRSLFKGNASDYGDAVLKLNNAASSSEMNHYIDLLQQRFGWDLESEAYQSFSVYVERKMLTLETSDANADQ